MSFVEKRQKGLTRRDFIRGTAAGAVGGVVIHHMPGWDEWITEVVRKFAYRG